MKQNSLKKWAACLNLVLWVFALISPIKAQNITAYEDYKNYLYVFDNGTKVQLDYRKAVAYQVGYNSVAFINSQDELWIYQNGKKNKVIEWARTFRQTDNFLVFGDNGFLNVYDNGKGRLLSRETGKYAFGDSIVVYNNIQNQSFEVYYNHAIHQIETDLIEEILDFKVGENILAYVNTQHYFLAYYHGKMTEIMFTDDPISYQVGLNTIAYINPSIESFHVIFNGNEEELEEYPPISYKCGDNMVAYVNMEGEFMQYYNGQKYDVSSFAPDFYKVVDNMLVYGLQGRLYTFYNGQNYELTNYIPNNYQIDKGSVAFIDQQGKLWLFNKGNLNQVDTERVTEFKLSGNTLHYDVGLNSHKVFFNGKSY